MPLSFSRRRLLMTALGSAALLIGHRSDGQCRMSRRGAALGTDVSMTVLAGSHPQAQRALDAAFAELETIEQVMSLYRPTSQLSNLNRDRELLQPHPYLTEVLAQAEATSRLSDGAFDITVQPLWDLFASASKQGSSVTDAQLAAARRSVDWRAVHSTPEHVRLRSPVQRITLNGIAQGFAVDRALAALQSHGITNALVNTGEIGSLGRGPDNSAWSAGIQHPRRADAYADIVALDGRALSTSGDYATAFTGNFSSHHIFDPRSGKSPEELASVSVLAPTGVQADALSTALFVMGPAAGSDLIASLPDVDACLILKSGRVLKTAGFPTRTAT